MDALKRENDTTTVKITVLSSDFLQRPDFGRFAVDFSSTRPTRERVALDYCHEDDEIVGFAESFESSDAGIFAVGTILERPGVDCRANEIAENVSRGVPYEASPLLDFSSATVESVPSGATAVVNGRTIAGPLDIYRGAVIRGVAVCPRGTDSATAVVAFSDAKTKEICQMIDEEKKPENEKPENDAPEKDEKKSVNAELEAMIEAFGKERGVDYYLDGLTLEEAERDDYEQLKAARDAADKKDADDEKTPDDPENESEPGAGADPTGAKPDDDKPDVAGFKALKRENEQIKRELAALKALVRRGAKEPVQNVDPEAARPNASPLEKAAQKFARVGVVPAPRSK